MENPLTKSYLSTHSVNAWKNTLTNLVRRSQLVVVSKLKRRRRYTLVLHRLKRNLVLAGGLIGFMVGLSWITINYLAKESSYLSTEDQESYSIVVPPHVFIDSIDTLEKWLRKELKLPYAKSHMIIRPASVLSGNKIAFTQLPESWEIKFLTHNSNFSVRYWKGDTDVLVIKREASFWALLKNIHDDSTSNSAWVLLTDAVVGGVSSYVVINSLIWSRLYYLRLLAVGFIGITLAISFGLVLNSLSLY
ncbi:MAG TPA: hypothetical protein PK068_01205 [Nitrosomonas sp.]|nr:hypothetical protein [Nitrosomonas sp.]